MVARTVFQRSRLAASAKRTAVGGVCGGQWLAVSAEVSGKRLAVDFVPIARAPSLTALENLDHHNGYLLNIILNYSVGLNTLTLTTRLLPQPTTHHVESQERRRRGDPQL